jgi:hypothetical protein
MRLKTSSPEQRHNPIWCDPFKDHNESPLTKTMPLTILIIPEKEICFRRKLREMNKEVR